MFNKGDLPAPTYRGYNNPIHPIHRGVEDEEDLGYSYGGVRYTNGGYKANPTRSAQIRARNAGALTNREARSMGLRNRREMEEDLGYSYGGVRYTNGGYKANPRRSD